MGIGSRVEQNDILSRAISVFPAVTETLQWSQGVCALVMFPNCTTLLHMYNYGTLQQLIVDSEFGIRKNHLTHFPSTIFVCVFAIILSVRTISVDEAPAAKEEKATVLSQHVSKPSPLASTKRGTEATVGRTQRWTLRIVGLVALGILPCSEPIEFFRSEMMVHQLRSL
jgi:hypothetical protein